MHCTKTDNTCKNRNKSKKYNYIQKQSYSGGGNHIKWYQNILETITLEKHFLKIA